MGEAVYYPGDALVGTEKSRIVTGTGYDDVVFGDGGYVGCLVDGFLQFGYVRALLGTDGYRLVSGNYCCVEGCC